MRFSDAVKTMIRRGAQSTMIAPTYSRGSWINGSTGEDWRRIVGSPESNGTVATCLQAIIDKIAQSGPIAGIYDARGNFKSSEVDTKFLALNLANGFGASFYEIIAMSQKIFGPAYGLVERNEKGGIFAIIPLMDPQVKPDIRDGKQVYHVMPHGGTQTVIVNESNIIDFSSGIPDPKNAKRKTSSLQMNLRAVCTDNEADTFNAALLRNLGMPGIVASPKEGEVKKGNERAVKDRIRDDLDNFTQDNRFRTWVTPVPADIKTVGFSPDQMGVSDTDKLAIQKICASLGIDPMAVGLPSETKTYANYSEARRAFIEDTILPTWDHILTPLAEYALANRWFTNPGTVLIVDRSKYVELNSDQFDKNNNAIAVFKAGISNRDEARAAVGLAPIKDTRTFFDMGGSSGGSADGTNTTKGLSRAQRLAAEKLHEITTNENEDS